MGGVKVNFRNIAGPEGHLFWLQKVNIIEVLKDGSVTDSRVFTEDTQTIASQ